MSPYKGAAIFWVIVISISAACFIFKSIFWILLGASALFTAFFLCLIVYGFLTTSPGDSKSGNCPPPRDIDARD